MEYTLKLVLLFSVVCQEISEPGEGNANYLNPDYRGSRYLDFNPENESTVAFYFSSMYSIGQDENLWIADPHEHTVKRVTPDNFEFPLGTFDLISGRPGIAGNRLSDANSALFNRPMSVVYAKILPYVEPDDDADGDGD
jgi:hypothetical protein